MEKLFRGMLSKVRFKLQQSVSKISSRVKSIASMMNLEDESTDSQKTFYLISFALLIFVIFLSPDKIAQVFTLTQADTGILEKVQEITKIIKKLLPVF